MIYHSKPIKIFVPHIKFMSLLDKLYYENNNEVKTNLMDKFGQIHKLPEVIRKDKSGNDVGMVELPLEDVKYVKELHESII
jgi:predicted RNA-binding protein